MPKAFFPFPVSILIDRWSRKKSERHHADQYHRFAPGRVDCRFLSLVSCLLFYLSSRFYKRDLDQVERISLAAEK